MGSVYMAFTIPAGFTGDLPVDLPAGFTSKTPVSVAVKAAETFGGTLSKLSSFGAGSPGVLNHSAMLTMVTAGDSTFIGVPDYIIFLSDTIAALKSFSAGKLTLDVQANLSIVDIICQADVRF